MFRSRSVLASAMQSVTCQHLRYSSCAVQVAAQDLAPGEDRGLRGRLRQLEARRSSVERAGLVHSALSGDGGVGGLDDMLRSVRSHLQAIAEQEQAFSTLAGQLFRPCRQGATWSHSSLSSGRAQGSVPQRLGGRLRKWAARQGAVQPSRGFGSVLALFWGMASASQGCSAAVNGPGKHAHPRTAATEGRVRGLQAVVREMVTLQMNQRQTLTQNRALRMLKPGWQQ